MQDSEPGSAGETIAREFVTRGVTILKAAYRGDVDTVNGQLRDAFDADGWRGLWFLIIAWNSIFMASLGDMHGDDGSPPEVRLSGLDTATGEECSVEETGAPRTALVAARIFIAQSNGDLDTAADLFEMAVANNEGGEVTTAVLDMTLNMLRSRLVDFSGSVN